MRDLAIAFALCILGGAAFAQERISRLVVPVPAGASLDQAARALAPRLSTATGETWIVENRPGAESMIGTEHVARAPADGRTVLVGGVTTVLGPQLRKVPFSPDDLRPVVNLLHTGYVVVVPAESPLRSVADLASAAASNPHGLNCGAPPGPMGLGCTQLGQRYAGRLQAVPYPGIAPALAALLGGHLDLLVVASDGMLKLIESGKVRVLATTAPLAGVSAPLVTDVWPGFVLETFVGLFVPAATPETDVRRLNSAVNRILSDPAFASSMRDIGQEPVGGTVEEFTARVGRVRAIYRDLLPRLGIEAR